MSTRATVHFADAAGDVAIVYRHGDGYPDGLGKDLETFLDEIDRNLKDKRFDDPAYLAAKWVVWDARQVQESVKGIRGRMGEATSPLHPLDFLSVGIVAEDPGDIEWRYRVNCNGGRPTVTAEEV